MLKNKYALQIGELIVCAEASAISTVLGSCVSVCVFSSSKRMGGMVHFAHAHKLSRHEQKEDFRYGDVAIPALVHELMAMTGQGPKTFSAKIVGGAAGPVGQENIVFARQALRQLGISVMGEDVGGLHGRKVIFHTADGRLFVAPTATDTATKILAIGASTGGTEALMRVICSLPPKIPPTVVVQHIPPHFSKAFADRLNSLCPFEVKEAEDRDELRPSRVLIAPGGKQMKVYRRGQHLFTAVTDDAPVGRHKPSVDYLFKSVATCAGAHSVGVILTGMGSDGAEGLLEMRNAGARTIGQDEGSCVVYGMPRAAYEAGAVEKVVPLSSIPKAILNFLDAKKAS